MSTREMNYWEDAPRAQAATDAILGGIGGGFVGAIVGYSILGVTSMGGDGKAGAVGVLAAITLPFVGTALGARAGAKRDRKGLSKAQSAAAGRGAAIGSVVPYVGSAAGAFYGTAKKTKKNPEMVRLKNGLL